MDVPTDGTLLFTLIFTDDHVLFEQDEFGLELMLNRQHKFYNNWGLMLTLLRQRMLQV
jgi:hypothetical protein